MRLAQASGIATPTREDLARLDRKRPKKGSNEDWTHPHDPDARINKMKDGRTHLAHKAEHAVDVETGAVVAVTIQPADQGDTETVKQTLITAVENVEAVKSESDGVQELVADKGYHSNDLLKDLRLWEFALTFASPRGAAETGKTITKRATLSMPIDGGFGENEGDGCSVNAVNVWSVLLRMRTKREDSAGCICAVG